MSTRIRPGNTLFDKDPPYISEWSPSNAKSTREVSYRASSPKYLWICPKGHEWASSTANRFLGNNCSVCTGRTVLSGVNDLATTHPHIVSQWSPKNSVSIQEVSRGSTKKVLWVCEFGHEWEASPNARIKKDSIRGCAYCSGNLASPGVSDVFSLYPHLSAEFDFDLNAVDPKSLRPGSEVKVWWKCSAGHQWEAQVNVRVRGSKCARCYAAYGRSQAEESLYAYVESLVGSPRVRANDRSAVSGYELDIYIPDMKLAIEFNGLYWHTESKKGRSYHRDKYVTCEKAGIRVITVWEDDWRDKTQIIKDMLAHKIGETEKEKIFARKTKVTVTNYLTASSFLDHNHIQGAVRGSIYLSLTHEEDVVAIMVLKREKDSLVLQRYATSKVVIGGHSKLISWVEANLEYESLITFADLEVSDGSLYERTGWTLDKKMPPDYMYVVKNTRVHKFNYRKSVFQVRKDLMWMPDMSETQLAALNSIPRIWGVGRIRYVKPRP